MAKVKEKQEPEIVLTQKLGNNYLLEVHRDGRVRLVFIVNPDMLETSIEFGEWHKPTDLVFSKNKKVYVRLAMDTEFTAKKR